MDDSLFRSPRPPDGPQRSLVIISRGATHELEDVLRGWAASVRRGLDLVVVRRCTNAERLRLERAHPGVRVLSAPGGRDVPALRELGVSAARGDIVVIQQDAAVTAAVEGAGGITAADAHGGEWALVDRAAAGLGSRR